jgi:hypothetical protein
MSDQETIDTVEDTAAAAIKRRYQAAINLPPDDLVKIIAEKLAEGVERSCRFPPMLHHQVAGVLWALTEIGALPPNPDYEASENS